MWNTEFEKNIEVKKNIPANERSTTMDGGQVDSGNKSQLERATLSPSSQHHSTTIITHFSKQQVFWCDLPTEIHANADVVAFSTMTSGRANRFPFVFVLWVRRERWIYEISISIELVRSHCGVESE